MGVGFKNFHDEYLANPPYDHMVSGNHRFIRGNHDNPAVCHNHTQCIKDGTIEGDVMFIGGAWSIDWTLRTEGYSWWSDEQCSQEQLNQFVILLSRKDLSIMITHDFPEGIVPSVFLNHNKEHIHTRTGQALESIRQLTRPALWIGVTGMK